MPVFGVPTQTERALREEVALMRRRAEKAENGRDRLARALLYHELDKPKPMLHLVSARLLGAGYTKDEIVPLLEQTKREHRAFHA